LSCIVLQAELWGEPERFRRLPLLSGQTVEIAGPDEILPNVRADEILIARHQDDGPIPLGFYTRVLKNTGLRFVFRGQFGKDPYSQLLRETFPAARFLRSQGVMGDLGAMRRARYLALSVSTFSWAAGWLSEAESAHMPLLEFFRTWRSGEIFRLFHKGMRGFSAMALPVRRWQALPAQQPALQAVAPVPWLTFAKVDAVNEVYKAARKRAQVADLDRLTRAARNSLRFIPFLRRIFAER
jgi:hypothetical protein